MISSAALIAAMVLAGPDKNDVAQAAKYRATRGVIVVDKEIQVPSVVAGKIRSIGVREGTVLKKKMQIAQMDDMDSQSRKKVADGELAIAISQQRAAPLKQTEARLTLDVAAGEFDSSLAMNKHEANTVSYYEVRRQKLTRDRAEVQLKTSAEDLLQANATAKTRQAQVDAINHEIERHKIIAPPEGGVVVEILKKAGEWVRQGDPVVRVIQMKQLKVEIFIQHSKYMPEEIDGKQIEFVLGNRKFSGEVTFINPIVESSGEYRVSAIIKNVRTAKGYWVLRPGMNVEISIR